MRADHFINRTMPRSVQREDEKNSSDVLLRDFSENQKDEFLLSSLPYQKIKNYQNLEALPHSFETDADVLQWACAVLSDSPMGANLLSEAAQTGWSLAARDLDHDGYHLGISDKIIELGLYNMSPKALGRSTHYRYNLICVLAKALRDVWHEERWGAFETYFKPEAVLLLERARAADSDCLSILMAWELRSAGHQEIWRHILASDDGDMAEVFTNIINRHPSAQYNGMAVAHMFRQWYQDEARLDAQDHATLQDMDDILEENDKNFGKRKVTAEEFELLSLMPDGTKYLSNLGATVAQDPFFNGLNDPVNQTHLFQIIYDNKVTYVRDIPFRDAKLARKFHL